MAALHLSSVHGSGATDCNTSSHMLAVIGGVVVRILKENIGKTESQVQREYSPRRMSVARAAGSTATRKSR